MQNNKTIKPFVSVIIPNYCHAHYLEERIKSVLNQTYQNFELIILDDCSPDCGASKKIIERYRSNPHVSQIIYNETNSGSPFKQWHKGIELAKGEYIWIAESDDSCEDSFLELILKMCIENNAVMGFCTSTILLETKDPLFINYHKQKISDTDYVFEGRDFIHSHLLRGNEIRNISSAVFKKNVALNIDNQYEEMKALGDWLFCIKMAEMGRVCFLKAPLNYFRRVDSCVTMKNMKDGNSYIEELKVISYLYSNQHISIIEKVRFKMYLIFLFTNQVYKNPKEKSNLLQLYDNYWLYRILYPAYLFYRYLRYNTIRQ
jgi:glycosyltransferase involved in cell wall biosynthesis